MYVKKCFNTTASLPHKDNLSLEGDGSFCKRNPGLLQQRAQITDLFSLRLKVKYTWKCGQDGPAQGLGSRTDKDAPEVTLRQAKVQGGISVYTCEVVSMVRD